MTLTRIAAALTIAALLAAPAGAGDLRQAAAAEAQAQAPTLTRQVTSSRKALMWSGAGIFAGGMATALFGFIRAGNGEFSTFGEATSRNKVLGAAGISAAFAGGTMMFLSSRAPKYAPSVAVAAGTVTIGKNVTW